MSRPHALPPEIRALIDRVLAAADLDPVRRVEVERDLIHHFEDGLADGEDTEVLVARFGSPEAAGRRIAAARPRRRAPLPPDPDESGSWGAWGPAVLSELRLALRSLIRAPSFTAIVLLTLALGVGANTAVFSVLDAVLLRPLPYPEPERLVRVEETWVGGGDVAEYVRAPTVTALREWGEVVSDVGTLYTYRETGVDLTEGDRPERVIAVRVSSGYFETLGFRPFLGRTFDEAVSFGPGEFGDGEPPAVAVLSHGLWTRRFGADPGIVGSTVALDGRPTEVVGVMDPGFIDPLGTPADLWRPLDLRLGGSNGWSNYYLTVVARLADDVSLDEARRRLGSNLRALQEAQPDSGDEWGIRMTPLQESIVGPARATLLWLLAGAVSLVLLSACVNAGNLVFARSLDRERSVALRGALGSSRRRLLAHVLAENLLLAVGGGLIGLILGLVGVRALLALQPDALPGLVEPGLSPGVFLFALAAMVGSLLLFGLAPALRLVAVPPAAVLRAGGRGGTEGSRLRRVRSGLVITQVAMALVLVVGAGLLVRSFQALQAVPLGVDAERVLTFEVHLPVARYPDGASRHAFHERFHDRIRDLPGVRAVGASSWLPLGGRYHTWSGVSRVGDPDGERPQFGTDVRIIAGDVFQALGIPRLRGAAPADLDLESEPVLWLSREVVERVFDEDEAVGTLVDGSGGERRVAGVVEDVALDARGRTAPTKYMPHAQYADNRNWALIQIVRAAGDLGRLQSAIEAELAGMDPELVLFRPRSFQSMVDRARAQDRFALFLMSVFASIALLLAAVGTYGVLAGAVARRTREIGIRMALGADAGRVWRGVLRGALGLVLLGIVVGTGIALLGTRWLEAFLFQVRPRDPITFAGGALLLVLVGVAASMLPARRATHVDPARCLAEE